MEVRERECVLLAAAETMMMIVMMMVVGHLSWLSADWLTYRSAQMHNTALYNTRQLIF